MRKAKPVLALAVLLGAAAACTSESASAPNDNADAAAATLDFDAGSGPHRASAELLRCAIGRKEPTSIGDAITRINALLPADGPCIVAALPRPLAIVATTSQESMQPAGGPDSPRIFFLLPNLVVAAVTSGKGSEVVEFGETTTGTRGTKGEIAVPVTAPLATDAAFTRVLNQQGIATKCAACHTNEQAASTPKAFVSDVIPPDHAFDMPIEKLSAMHDTCTATNDPSGRCAMLHAVFDVGPVTQGSFDTK